MAGNPIAIIVHMRSMATAPTLEDFRLRYPAFTAAPDASVQYRIGEKVAEVAMWPNVNRQ